MWNSVITALRGNRMECWLPWNRKAWGISKREPIMGAQAINVVSCFVTRLIRKMKWLEMCCWVVSMNYRCSCLCAYFQSFGKVDWSKSERLKLASRLKLAQGSHVLQVVLKYAAVFLVFSADLFIYLLVFPWFTWSSPWQRNKEILWTWFMEAFIGSEWMSFCSLE